MSNLKATFSTGRTITRKTEKAYSFAWLAVNKQKTISQSQVGFSMTKDGAERSAKAAFSGFGGETFTEVVAVA